MTRNDRLFIITLAVWFANYMRPSLSMAIFFWIVLGFFAWDTLRNT